MIYSKFRNTTCRISSLLRPWSTALSGSPEKSVLSEVVRERSTSTLSLTALDSYGMVSQTRTRAGGHGRTTWLI